MDLSFYTQENHDLGIDALNKLGLKETIKSIKEIVKPIIPEDVHQKLIDLTNYLVEFKNDKIVMIELCFGEDYELYKVYVNPFNFQITKQNGHTAFSEHIKSLKTIEQLNK